MVNIHGSHDLSNQKKKQMIMTSKDTMDANASGNSFSTLLNESSNHCEKQIQMNNKQENHGTYYNSNQMFFNQLNSSVQNECPPIKQEFHTTSQNAMNPIQFPQFSLDPDKITILHSPSEFHEKLIHCYREARYRIILAALYIGTGELEKEVIDAIHYACLAKLNMLNSQDTQQQTVSSDNEEIELGSNDDLNYLQSNSIIPPQLHNHHCHLPDSVCPPSTVPYIISSDTNGLKKKIENTLHVDIMIDAARGVREETLINGDKASSLTILNPLFQLKKQLSRRHPIQSSSQKIVNVVLSDESSTTHSSSLSSRNSSSCRLISRGTLQSSLDDSIPLKSDYLEPDVDINIHLFHSPLLSGFLYSILPPRINEILGVFHTKIFLMDNTIILTGANLSDAYLTNRQDRYIVIDNAPLLADFLQSFMSILRRFSFQASISQINTQQIPMNHCHYGRYYQLPYNHTQEIHLKLNCDIPSPITQSALFKNLFSHTLNEFLNQQQLKNHVNPSSTTTISIAIQAGFGIPPIEHEKLLLQTILVPNIQSLRRHWMSSVDTNSVMSCHGLLKLWKTIWNQINSIYNQFISIFQSSTQCLESSSTFFKKQNDDDDNDTTSLKLMHQLSYESISPHTAVSSLQSPRSQEITPSKEQHVLHNTTHSFFIPSSSTRETTLHPETNYLHNSIHDDSNPVNQLINFPQQCSHIVIASGYLNMPDDLLQQLTLALKQFHGIVLTDIDHTNSYLQHNSYYHHPPQLEIFVASPTANSFHQSRGLSKYIPIAYTYVGAKQLKRLRELWDSSTIQSFSIINPTTCCWNDPFQLCYLFKRITCPFLSYVSNNYSYGCLRRRSHSNHKHNSSFVHETPAVITNQCHSTGPVFWEYKRHQWTFHSKGLWVYPHNTSNNTSSNFPIATIIGSSNFGLRSRIRDLDASFMIQTTNTQLQKQFHQEVQLMRQHCTKVNHHNYSNHYRCPTWLKFLLNWTGIKTLL